MTNKVSSSSIKILEFLKLFYENDATYDKVKKLLASNETDINGSVMLNKYLNTLKVFGITVKKQGQKFVIYNLPNSMNINESDLKTLISIKNTLDIMPNSKLKRAVSEFLENIFSRLDGNSRAVVEQSSNSEFNKDLSFYYSTYQTQVEKCEQMCEENYPVEVSYKGSNGKTVYITRGTPKEVKYMGRKIFFVLEEKDKLTEIQISKIVSVKQLPAKIKSFGNRHVVMFRLKGRLARSYKERPHETCSFESDGTRVVVNNGEDVDELVLRLIRYQDLCEIISPKFVKEKMHNTISSMLNLYKNND